MSFFVGGQYQLIFRKIVPLVMEIQGVKSRHIYEKYELTLVLTVRLL